MNLYDPFRMTIAYETMEEVLESYLWFGAEDNQGVYPQFTPTPVNNVNSWFNLFMQDLVELMASNCRVIGHTIELFGPKTSAPPPFNYMNVWAGGSGEGLPSDTNFNFSFVGTRPDNKFTRGGIRLGTVPRQSINAGRIKQAVVNQANAGAMVLALQPITIGTRTYRLAIKGKYKNEALQDVPYLVSVDTARLQHVAGSRKDRIPNRSNFPKGTP